MSIAQHEETVSIGARFKVERERLVYTQEQLAKLLDTSQKTLISYETGATLPKLDKLVLFHGLGADLMYISLGTRQPVDLGRPQNPAHRLAAEIAALDLSDADADLIAPVARRLAGR